MHYNKFYNIVKINIPQVFVSSFYFFDVKENSRPFFCEKNLRQYLNNKYNILSQNFFQIKYNFWLINMSSNSCHF